MLIAQAIATFFAVLVLVKSYDEFRHGREPIIMFIFWTVIWLSVLLVAFFPAQAIELGKGLFGEDVGLGTFFGIITVFGLFLAYRLYIKAERAERRVNQLLTMIATNKLKK